MENNSLAFERWLLRGAPNRPAAQAFIDFATSDAASELIVNAGAVPVAK